MLEPTVIEAAVEDEAIAAELGWSKSGYCTEKKEWMEFFFVDFIAGDLAI